MEAKKQHQEGETDLDAVFLTIFKGSLRTSFINDLTAALIS
ncbi:hypothetical protein [Peribacillus cavernae]|nr:hypothetical protein [Peribacillus cavernae]MDQ0219270.1 hypothetical protein [Peribacillus cavernae]